jgi:desulfoferrodoxin (superoxide reductase-like protein)
METQEKSDAKPVKLTKKGLPDKRAESSKKNLEKGKSIIKQALQKIKETPKLEVKPKLPIVYSSDEYSTDEEEIVLTTKELIKPTKVADQGEKKNIPVIALPKLERNTEDINEGSIIPESSPEEHYTFTFEKKLEEKIKALNEDYTKKLSLIENDTKLTKAELKAIKEQNQALKKSMTSSFRTHAGTLNQEMYLKF